MKITKLSVIGVTYATGAGMEKGDKPVEKIVYHGTSNLYNKGKQIGGPAYVIFFKDSDVRIIIPEREVVSMAVDTEKSKKKEAEVNEEAALGVGVEVVDDAEDIPEPDPIAVLDPIAVANGEVVGDVNNGE
jgi:hypothetical protein